MVENLRHAVIFVGPPLCGKGTQAERLVRKAYFHINCGELLRKDERFTEILKTGDLVSDEPVIDVVYHRIPEKLPYRITFDGFPRSVGQSLWLKKFLAVNQYRVGVVVFDLPEECLLSRREKRIRIAKENGNEVRDDDTPECILERYKKYQAYGPKVIDLMSANSSKLLRIDATESIEQIQLKIARMVDVEWAELTKSRIYRTAAVL